MFRIACSTITWRGQAPLEEMLAEIAQAGYQGAPVSLREDVPPEKKLADYARHGLTPAPGYMGAAFWDPSQEAGILADAAVKARASRALGCADLYVAANCTPDRREIAGRVRPEDALSDEGYAQFARALNQVGRITLEHGVRACFHNHVGSVIERRSEIDRLFSLVDPDLVFHGPDIGHLAWAGDDVAAYCRDYAGSIKTVHLKDIDPRVLREGVEKRWDYRAFSDHGIFAELGEGFVDFPAIFEVLADAGFDGSVVVETDVTQKATPQESAIISREYLKKLGMR